MATAASTMIPYQFDDRNIQWRELGDFKHLVASIFFVDEEKNIVDFIIKFDPNEKVLLHRHLAATTTFVVDGEHRIYEPNGQLREVRPVGRYTFSTASDAHNEGGGPTGGIVYFNVRGQFPGRTRHPSRRHAIYPLEPKMNSPLSTRIC